jgi:hypothetical protein
MARRYDSFVIRCWRVSDDQRRIEVEHLQSGGRTRVSALTAAVDWITTQCGDSDARATGARHGPAAPAEEVMPSESEATEDKRTA